LIQLANGTNFWNLPEAIAQKNSKNDESWFITVNSPCTNHSVILYDRSKADSDTERFAQMYSLLAFRIPRHSYGGEVKLADSFCDLYAGKE
jgi:hypothetical protein